MLASTAVSGRSPKTEFCSPARGRSPWRETIPYRQYLRAYRRSAPNRPRLPQARSARRKTLIGAVEALADSLRLAIYLCELISLHQQRAIGIGRLSALARVLAGQPFQATQ
jgi:hypothetical protein